MSILLAFTVEHAARATKISERRIRYWDKTGVLTPSLARGQRRTLFGRVYSFGDLVAIRTLAELRDRYGLPLQKLRKVGRYLSARHDNPWGSLSFSIQGRDIVFQDPDSELRLSTDFPGQSVLPLDLVEIERQTEEGVRRLSLREPDQLGKVVQNRYVMRNAPVVAGTRIPTSAVWNFHQAGRSIEDIRRAYPRLTSEDIEAAIAHEKSLRQEHVA